MGQLVRHWSCAVRCAPRPAPVRCIVCVRLCDSARLQRCIERAQRPAGRTGRTMGQRANEPRTLHYDIAGTANPYPTFGVLIFGHPPWHTRHTPLLRPCSPTPPGSRVPASSSGPTPPLHPALMLTTLRPSDFGGLGQTPHPPACSHQHMTPPLVHRNGPSDPAIAFRHSCCLRRCVTTGHAAPQPLSTLRTCLFRPRHSTYRPGPASGRKPWRG